MSDRIEVVETDENFAGRLGRRLVWHDEQSKDYAARGTLFAADAPLRDRIWRRPRAWDQGNSEKCVIFTGRGLISSLPFSKTIPKTARQDPYDYDGLYAYAQSVDPWPGHAYGGTSTLAGLKALHKRGIIPGYRWCFGVDDTLRTLANYGSVALGTIWLKSMFGVNEQGVINVDPDSGQAGGHETHLHGIDVGGKDWYDEDDEVIGTNSWSVGWGDGGRFRMKVRDLRYLLEDRHGEVATLAPAIEAYEQEA